MGLGWEDVAIAAINKLADLGTVAINKLQTDQFFILCLIILIAFLMVIYDFIKLRISTFLNRILGENDGENKKPDA